MKNSNKKGFTLVELVVVIAIIGVLAAILVPSMMGYVKKARLKTANGNAKTAYNGVSEYLADKETEGELASADEQEAADAGAKELSTNGKGSGIVGVTWDDDPADTSLTTFAFTVQWHKAEGDEIVGQYPDPASKLEDCPAWSSAAEADASAM